MLPSIARTSFHVQQLIISSWQHNSLNKEHMALSNSLHLHVLFNGSTIPYSATSSSWILCLLTANKILSCNPGSGWFGLSTNANGPCLKFGLTLIQFGLDQPSCYVHFRSPLFSFIYNYFLLLLKMKKRKKKSNIYNVKTSILRPLNECHVFNFGARTLDWAQLPSHAEGSLSNSIVYISHVTERKGVAS